MEMELGTVEQCVGFELLAGDVRVEGVRGISFEGDLASVSNPLDLDTSLLVGVHLVEVVISFSKNGIFTFCLQIDWTLIFETTSCVNVRPVSSVVGLIVVCSTCS